MAHTFYMRNTQKHNLGTLLSLTLTTGVHMIPTVMHINSFVYILNQMVPKIEFLFFPHLWGLVDTRLMYRLGSHMNPLHQPIMYEVYYD